MGCSSSKLHPLGSETYDLLDENMEKRKELQNSFHEDFAIGLCQINAPIVTFVESVTCYSRSTPCDSEETMSGLALTVQRSSISQSSSNLQDNFEFSEKVVDAPVDDESDLKEWLREIEETICTNTNQDRQLRTISQGEWDLMRTARITNEFNSFYKETTKFNETRSAESDYRNNTSTPCQRNELRSDDLTPVITIEY